VLQQSILSFICPIPENQHPKSINSYCDLKEDSQKKVLYKRNKKSNSTLILPLEKNFHIFMQNRSAIVRNKAFAQITKIAALEEVNCLHKLINPDIQFPLKDKNPRSHQTIKLRNLYMLGQQAPANRKKIHQLKTMLFAITKNKDFTPESPLPSIGSMKYQRNVFLKHNKS
jgi:hypothetical protein